LVVATARHAERLDLLVREHDNRPLDQLVISDQRGSAAAHSRQTLNCRTSPFIARSGWPEIQRRPLARIPAPARERGRIATLI